MLLQRSRARARTWSSIVALLVCARVDQAYAGGGNSLCSACAVAGTACATSSGELTLPRSMGGLPFDFTIESGTPLACREGYCSPEYVPSPAELCSDLLLLKQDTQSRKRLLLSFHTASKPENELALSSWLLHFKEQSGHRTDGRSLLATAPRGRGPITPGSVIYTTINGSVSDDNSTTPTFDPDLLPQIQADDPAKNRGLVNEEAWLDAMLPKAAQPEVSMLAYREGYASLLATDPEVTTQHAASAVDCFQQCRAADGCQAWTAVAEGARGARRCYLIWELPALYDNSTMDAEDVMDELVEFHLDAVHESGTMQRIFPDKAYGCPYKLAGIAGRTCAPDKAPAPLCKRGRSVRACASALGRRSLPALPLYPLD